MFSGGGVVDERYALVGEGQGDVHQGAREEANANARPDAKDSFALVQRSPSHGRNDRRHHHYDRPKQ